MAHERILTLEEQLKLANDLIVNCSANIEIVAINQQDDRHFIGFREGKLRNYRMTDKCNSAYTWQSSIGSIQEIGPAAGLESYMIPSEEVGSDQLEMEFDF